jgi:hypothetical protein
MKKKSKRIMFFVMAVSVLFAGLSLSGCATITVRTYDKSTPVSESSAIYPLIGLTIVYIDGNPITTNSGLFIMGVSNGWITNKWLLIPAGAHTITVNYYNYGTGYGAEITTAPYEFEAGHYYKIWDDSADDGRVSLTVVDVTGRESDKDVAAARKKIEAMR